MKRFLYRHLALAHVGGSTYSRWIIRAYLAGKAASYVLPLLVIFAIGVAFGYVYSPQISAWVQGWQ